MKREPLSKKLRFDVFKRDRFSCQYCGNCPPKVVLEVDHIVPVVSGGKNTMSNLVAACFDCNRGKGKHGLEVIPQTIEQQAALRAEKLEQMKAFDRLLKRERKFLDSQVDQIELVFQRFNKGFSFTDTFRASVQIFLSKIPFEEVERAMITACSKRRQGGSNGELKYFCAICWAKIREANQE